MAVETLLDLDYCRYLLNFDSIELGLTADGTWSVYLRRSCQHLDPETKGCLVHGTGEQPHICQHYNPYRCWYRNALSEEGVPDFLRINRDRLQALLAGVTFDEDRNIVAVPAWEWMQEELTAIPLDPDPPLTGAVPGPPPGATPDGSAVTPRTLLPLRDVSVIEPCSDCSAPCCTTLAFGVSSTLTTSGLDHLRFSLGFPGVELGIADDGWTLAVRTRCRHLVDGRCAVYGRDDRPLACSYYDAYRCTYKTAYGTARPEGFLRVGGEELPWVLECVGFDETGRVAAVPTVAQLRWHVERRRAEKVAGQPPEPLPDFSAPDPAALARS
jgi:hypothetical protein